MFASLETLNCLMYSKLSSDNVDVSVNLTAYLKALLETAVIFLLSTLGLLCGLSDTLEKLGLEISW